MAAFWKVNLEVKWQKRAQSRLSPIMIIVSNVGQSSRTDFIHLLQQTAPLSHSTIKGKLPQRGTKRSS